MDEIQSAEKLLAQQNGIYLGLDLSSQQFKAVAINDMYNIVAEQSVHFDSELPEFRTQGGVNKSPKSSVVTANPLMWIKAIELLMDKLKIAGVELWNVKAVGGCAQQHGSVYWKKGTAKILAELDPSKFLHVQLQNVFSVRDSPIWQDSSTKQECDDLEQEVGGSLSLAQITGSRAYCRFTGSQILKIRRESPQAYEQTERISLISSFVATLLMGKYAALDLSDASGMNLLDLSTLTWNEKLINFCGGEQLKNLLDEPVPTGQVLGNVSQYFSLRHGLPEDCKVTAFTGDNPASLVGMCIKPKDLVVSLGTSDTLFFSTDKATPSTTGHILVSPLCKNQQMVLICFKNGSETRERISRECAENNWKLFGELLDSIPRGNFGNIGLYFDQTEITPQVSGDYRFNRFDQPVARFSKEVEVRACVEGQFVRLRAHAQKMGFKASTGTQTSLEDPDQVRILATGGASCNQSLLQVLADVFNCAVYVQKRPHSACFGGALLAKSGLSPDAHIEEFLQAANSFELSVKPANDSNQIYADMVRRYLIIEQQLANGGN